MVIQNGLNSSRNRERLHIPWFIFSRNPLNTDHYSQETSSQRNGGVKSTHTLLSHG